MLSAHAVSSPHQAASYFDKDDYYRSGSLGPSAWFGEGAKALNLYGDVDRSTFQELLAGRLPDGTQLGTRTEADFNHKPGMDLTFSAPKSVSIMAEAVGDTRLIDAHDYAVRETLAQIEAQSLYTRVREDGEVKHVRTGNMTAALFRHDLNRNNDPDLHTHAVGINATRTSDGQWRSVEWRPALRQIKEYGKLYRTILAAEVVKLGYAIQIGKEATFELASVPPELVTQLSSRSSQIEERLEAQGLTRETATTEQKARATIQTRSAKTSVDRAELTTHWQNQIGAGFAALQQAADEARSKIRPDHADHPTVASLAATRIVFDAIEQLSDRQAAFSHGQLRTLAMESGLGSMSPRAVDDTIRAFVEQGKLLPRDVTVPSHITRKDDLQAGYTTPDAVQTERRMLDYAEKGRGAVRALTSERTAESAVAAAEAASGRLGFKWNDEQRSATIGVLTSTDQITAIQGRAGTTKTTTVLATVIGVARAKGHRIVALAPTASAAATLGKATGTEAMTVHRFVGTAANQRTKPSAFAKLKTLFAGKREPVWIVDEASLLGVRKMTELLSLANRYHARVILTGDYAQLGSVEAGRAFEQLIAAGVSTQRLENIQRQNTDVGRAAVNAAIRRDAAAALRLIASDNGRIIVSHDYNQRIAEIAALYTGLPREKRASTLVIDPSREGSEALKQAIRQGLLDKRELERDVSTDGTRLIPKKLADTEKRHTRFYEPGDVLRFSRNQTAGSERIASGEYLTVVSLGARSLTVQRANGASFQWTPPKTTRDIAVYQQFAGTLNAGERVRWTRNEGPSRRPSRNRGHTRGLANGEFGTVSKIAGRQVELIMDNGKTVTIDPTKRSDQHFDYGYAVTSYAAQGRTETLAIFHAESYRINLINAASFYVGLSRHKDAAIVVTDDRQGLINAINDRAGINSSALEIKSISDAAERTVRKESDLLNAPTINPVQDGALAKMHNPSKPNDIERVQQQDLQL